MDNNVGNIQKEINNLRKLKYDKLCDYLKQKYGLIDGSYFINEKCKTKNEKIKRTGEGLFVHHIYEKKAIMLSHSEYAVKFPFEWQEGNNLVYCNYFEHMLLHVAIVKEFLIEESQKTRMAVGIGGLINYIIPEIIDYINGYEYARDYMKKALSIIDGNELLFIDIVEGLQNYILNHHDVFEVAYEVCHKSFRRFRSVFSSGKMTKNGKYDDFLFKYKVIMKQIKLIDSSYFESIVESALNRPAHHFKFDYCPHGEYYYIRFSYHNKNNSIIWNDYAISSDDQIDIHKLEEKYFRKMIISDKIYNLIKKDSVVSCKENKKSKNKIKKYCLTVDGIVVEYHNYTKEQAIEFVKKNQHLYRD